jgi:hypothetical protein
VRLQQHLKYSEADESWRLDSITAWKEFFYEPFKNASSLCASCGGPNKWGEDEAIPAKTLAEGEWSGDPWNGFEDGLLPGTLLLLPSGMYSVVAYDPESGLRCEAGWFVPDGGAAPSPAIRDRGKHLVSSRAYDSRGALRDATFAGRRRNRLGK